jgi:hypothetical protein
LSLDFDDEHSPRNLDFRVSSTQYAVQVGNVQWVRIPPGQSVAQPEAIGAMMDQAGCVTRHQRVTLVKKGPLRNASGAEILPASATATDASPGFSKLIDAVAFWHRFGFPETQLCEWAVETVNATS